ncbi:uncharacterized protein LOC100904851 [Galendromus occidentalis]|uniref:Uncharacterized protein LOC100904851 n=1 Tax=Galendromus occidentalis TaxID=34638 RepID=A0AAJ6QRX7_9ACAR|nr:uncharacterized protein LOC100904851 [Galendromus occidentalis]
MFPTSYVPLVIEGESGSVAWKNSKPSSTRLCRPLRFTFAKETPEVTREEVQKTKTEIVQLRPSKIKMAGQEFQVEHRLLLTMIDGKVAQVLCDVPSMAVCCVCGALSSEMNKLEAISQRAISSEALQFGLSPLHARIKSMECFLHISYRLQFRSWRINARTTALHNQRKRGIQQKFRQRLGLLVDVVGSTVDGNTARKFFADPEVTSEITGIDADLLRRFSVILDAINCKLPLDSAKFGSFCSETARSFVELYGWYYMPNTVHKLLMHGK